MNWAESRELHPPSRRKCGGLMPTKLVILHFFWLLKRRPFLQSKYAQKRRDPRVTERHTGGDKGGEIAHRGVQRQGRVGQPIVPQERECTKETGLPCRPGEGREGLLQPPANQHTGPLGGGEPLSQQQDPGLPGRCHCKGL